MVNESGDPIAPLSSAGRPRTPEEAISRGMVTPATEDWRDLLTGELLPLGEGESPSETLQRLRE